MIPAMGAASLALFDATSAASSLLFKSNGNQPAPAGRGRTAIRQERLNRPAARVSLTRYGCIAHLTAPAERPPTILR